MIKVRFTGRILPSAFNVSIPLIPKIHWKETKPVVRQLSFGISITKGNIVVDCETDQYEEATDFIQIYRRALDLARGVVDLFAFSIGAGVTTVLDKFTHPDGKITEILPGDPTLRDLSTCMVSGSGDFENLLGMVLVEPTLFQALRDMIDAITLPHVGPRSATRAMEGIRHLLAPGKERKKSWAIMCKTLNISETYLRNITDISVGPRHADPTFIPGTTVSNVVRNAWIVMNRYFEYRKLGSQPLPLSVFPLLT